MSVTSTQGFNYRLVSGNTILDLFSDEDILMSDNVTGLFDIGVLPSDFTRQFTLPGTKKNNQFFEFYYDISVYNPFTFAGNEKVEAYIDYNGIYIAQGYIQLNKVNVIANKFIDSYVVTLYGTVSNFARDINRSYLTDLSSLREFNHTASISNITSSWDLGLFGGAIVYPMAEYGQKISYSPEEPYYGIDGTSGSMTVQDYKPAIRVKEVWDSIFDTFGYTYTGSFFEKDWLNGVYMLGNNGLKYLQLSSSFYGTSSINLETYGQFKIGAFSGSGQTNVTMSVEGQDYLLPWYSIQSNPQNNIDANLNYNISSSTSIKGNLNLSFEVQPSGSAPQGYPQFNLILSSSNGAKYSSSLSILNDFMEEVWAYNVTTFTKKEKFSVLSEFVTPYVPTGSYKFYLEWDGYNGDDFSVVLDPDNKPQSYLEVTKLNNAADGKIVDIPSQMPFGTSGIKLVDFISGIQKKFNLVIYPNKRKPNQFIVETFNEWYNAGEIKNFDRYMNLNDNIEVTPANNLAVNELTFGDTLDTDYLSQQFAKAANREYGKSYYIDTENFFSQGKFDVKTTFASSPLLYIQGTGNSGSIAETPDYRVFVTDTIVGTETITCLGQSYNNTQFVTVAELKDSSGNDVINFGASVVVNVRYDVTSCTGGTSTDIVGIVIPYGSPSGSYTYYQTGYVDCGFGTCDPETKDIDCVSSITGQSFPLTGSSPIQSC